MLVFEQIKETTYIVVFLYALWNYVPVSRIRKRLQQVVKRKAPVSFEIIINDILILFK